VRDEVQRISAQLERESYIADPAIATSIWLAMSLGRPLLVEGHAGVGKTEIAKVLARVLDTELIRLQCYEGLDATTALYEWNFPRQMLRLRLEEGTGRTVEEREASIFERSFLLERPLLRAITHEGRAPVLLIDEVDRADEEFEAFLLEVLSDFQVTVPEIGTIRATHRPYVVLTSNRTRELSDALRRRCLFLWIDHPPVEKETRIVRAKVPGIDERLTREVTAFVQSLRQMDLSRTPGVAETLDWAAALVKMHASALDESLIRETMGCVVKDQGDMRRVEAALREPGLPALLRQAS
jgi:MoxR-like ATPase